MSERKLVDVDVTLLEPHPANRKHFDPKKLEELTENIRRQGIHTPIILRALEPDRFQIIAGERRWRAALGAKLTTVPAVIRELSDDEALEVLLTENLQREDPHPIEEAETYAAWLKRPGHDVKELAARVGKSIAHVYSRLQLRNLSEKARELVWGNGLPIGHALILARVPAAQQDIVLERLEQQTYHGTPTLNQFTRTVTAAGLTLEDAPFDRTDATLCPGAGSCVLCPKRLHFADGMFPELAEEIQKAEGKGEDKSAMDAQLAEDKCLDPACWGEKVDAHLAKAIATAKEAYGEELVLLTTKHGTTYPSKATAPLPQGIWKPAKKKDSGATPGLVVKTERFSDHKIGEFLWVTLKPRPKEGAKAAPAPAPTDHQADSRKQEEERKARIAKEQPRRLALAQAIFAKVPAKLDTDLLVEIALDSIQSWAIEEGADRLKVSPPKKLSVKSHPRDVMRALTLALANADLEDYRCAQKDSVPENLLSLAQRFGVDAKKVLLAHDATVKAKEKKVVA